MIHIISACVLAGTGAGIAFLCGWLGAPNMQLFAQTAKHVVLADFIFTLPAVITQLVSGLLLMNLLGIPINLAGLLR